MKVDTTVIVVNIRWSGSKIVRRHRLWISSRFLYQIHLLPQIRQWWCIMHADFGNLSHSYRMYYSLEPVSVHKLHVSVHSVDDLEAALWNYSGYLSSVREMPSHKELVICAQRWKGDVIWPQGLRLICGKGPIYGAIKFDWVRLQNCQYHIFCMTLL